MNEPHPPDSSSPTDAAAADPVRRRRVSRTLRITGIVVLVLLAIGATRTIVTRMSNSRTLEAAAGESGVAFVRTTRAREQAAAQTLALPGTLQGAQQASISSRASGYVRRWAKDIGSSVRQGELLAEIESPEIDQQLSQAVAARQQTAASLGLAKSTVERWEAMRKRDVVSQQELEERRSAVAQATANLAAADANVQRLRQLQGFTRITAPFSGVITRRNVEVGDLIDSGGRVLFTLTQTDPLRVYVNVPQAYAQLVKPGQPVSVQQAELRGQRFPGEVARSAAAIDAASRTMQVEVALRNRGNLLLPGAYVQVELPLTSAPMLVVPTNVLLFRGEGTRIAVVDAQSRVRLRPVTLGRNLGEAVEVQAGVLASDRLVVNPSDSLADGDAVTVRNPPEPAASGAAASRPAP